MQVNSINSFSNINFQAGHQKTVKKQPQTENMQPQNSKGFMSAVKAPVIAAMFLVPAINTGCEPREIIINNKAEAIVTIPGTPRDTIINNDTIIGGNDTIINNDTIFLNDTIYKNDTIFINDTVYIPPEFEFPYEIEDSLNRWRGDILDVPVDGDDGDYTNKALLYLSALRDWEYSRPEQWKLNLEKSDATEARYDHTIADSIKNDIRITVVKPGDLTVVKKDGSVTDNISGLLFNEDGVKTFMHSNGVDKIYVYPKATSGEYNGKYVEKYTIEPGYLDKDEDGENILLNGYLAEGTEDHFTHVKGKVMDVDRLRAIAEDIDY